MKIWQRICENWKLLALFILLALIFVIVFYALFSYLFGEHIYIFLKNMSSGQEKITRLNEVGASIIGYALAVAGVLVTMLIALLGLRNSELQASEYIEKKFEHAVMLYARLGVACTNAFYLAYEAPFTEQIPDEGLTENSLQLREAEEFHQRMLEALDKIASALEAMSESGIAKSLFQEMRCNDSYFDIIEREQEKLRYFSLHPAFQQEYSRIQYKVDKEKADEAVSQADQECSQHAATHERTELLDCPPADEQSEDMEDVEAQDRADRNHKQEKEQEILKKTVLALAEKKNIPSLNRRPFTYSDCAFLIRTRIYLLKNVGTHVDIRYFPRGDFPRDAKTHEAVDRNSDRWAAYWLGYYMGFEVHCQVDSGGELIPVAPCTYVPSKDDNGMKIENCRLRDPGYAPTKEELKRPRDVFFYAHTGFALLRDLLRFMPTKEIFRKIAKECYPGRDEIIDRIPFDEKVMMEMPLSLSDAFGKEKPWVGLTGRFVDLGRIYHPNATCLEKTFMTKNRWDFRKLDMPSSEFLARLEATHAILADCHDEEVPASSSESAD